MDNYSIQEIILTISFIVLALFIQIPFVIKKKKKEKNNRKEFLKSKDNVRNYIQKNLIKINNNLYVLNNSHNKSLAKLENLYWNKISESQRDYFKNEWLVAIGEKHPSGFKTEFLSNTARFYIRDVENSFKTRGYLIEYDEKVIFINSKFKGQKFIIAYIFAFADALSYEKYNTVYHSIWLNTYYKNFLYRFFHSSDYRNDTFCSEQITFNVLPRFKLFAYCYIKYFLDGKDLKRKNLEFYECIEKITHKKIKRKMNTHTP